MQRSILPAEGGGIITRLAFRKLLGMLYKLNMNSGYIIATFRSSLEGQGRVKIFPVGRTVRGVRGHLLCVEEVAWGETADSWAMVSGLTEWTENGLGKWRKGSLVYYRSGPTGVSMKGDALCVTYSAHQKVSTVQKSLNNQVGKLIQPVDSQLSSSATPEMSW